MPFCVSGILYRWTSSCRTTLTCHPLIVWNNYWQEFLTCKHHFPMSIATTQFYVTGCWTLLETFPNVSSCIRSLQIPCKGLFHICVLPSPRASAHRFNLWLLNLVLMLLTLINDTPAIPAVIITETVSAVMGSVLSVNVLAVGLQITVRKNALRLLGF